MIKDPIARAAYKHKWYLENRERTRPSRRQWQIDNRDKCNESCRNWRKNNPERRKALQAKSRNKDRNRYRECARNYYYRNKAKCRDSRRAWAAKNPGYYAKRHQIRKTTEPEFRMLLTLRTRLRNALQNNWKSGTTIELLGCSIDDFKIYLESKFEPGMSWDNHGKGRGKWHIDHIMPCAIFDLTKPEHQRRCFHFSNLQPLFCRDNLVKGAKVLTNQFQLL